MHKKGIKYLTEHPHIWIINKSYVYESHPMYYFEQKDYYNMVLEIDTNLEPLDLLGILKDIEKKCGRKNNNCKNMPRELDIDILAIDSLFIRSNILNIPHIASEHIVFKHYLVNPLKSLSILLAPLFLDAFVCVSNQALKSFPKLTKKKFIYIVNPINIKSSLRADILNKNIKEKTILSIGRLEKQKNYIILIKAFSLLSKK